MKNEKKKWQRILDRFIPYSGFDVSDYYGVSMIKTKRDNKYRVKLIYDYESNAKMSKNQLEITSLSDALEIYRILEINAQNKGEVKNIDDLLLADDEIEENEDKERWDK